MRERTLNDLPRLGAATADTHAHLNMLDDPAGALERAGAAGVSLIATIADATEAPLGTFDSLSSWLEEADERLTEWGVPDVDVPEVRIMVGVHPHNAKSYTPDLADELKMLAGDDRVVAIGEIGLDYHYEHSPREFQRSTFEAQLGLAHDLGLPVAIHLREAHEDGLAVLRAVGVPEAGCILHCFTEGPKTAGLFLDLGCDISFAGTVTFKSADTVRHALRSVPMDRLLVETDAPFMTPEPFRGRSNEPAWVVFTVARIADVIGADPSEVAAAAMTNARRVFGMDGLA